MMSVTKTFTFDAAHVLPCHKGLCKNLHGHTYKLEVVATAKTLNDSGMIVDFGELSLMVKERIISEYDHAFILNASTEDPFERELEELLSKHNKKIAYMSAIATAENMAEHFWDILNAYNLRDSFKIWAVRVYETPTSVAEYSDVISDC